MKDILQDIVAHTHTLGDTLSVIKVVPDEGKTTIKAMADDRTIVLSAVTKTPVTQFNSVFGLTNLAKLSLHLKNPEYEANPKIEIVEETKNNEKVPSHIHFENEKGDFQNDFRFMSKTAVEERVKSLKFKGTNWNFTFQPAIIDIQRLKLMSAANSEESFFNVYTEKTDSGYDLMISFGNNGTHSGKFVFKSGIGAPLAHTQMWPISQVQSILGLTGDKKISISDNAVMLISVDSGLIDYDYILPAVSS